MRHRSIAAAFFAVAVLFFSADRAAAQGGKNLQVLDKNISSDELKRTMEAYSAQLGVKCTFCHVGETYEKDDLKRKQDARKMIRLVAEMRTRKGDFFKTTVKDNAIQCAMCHRGRPQPEAFVP